MNAIEIYTHPGCACCNGARRYLLEEGETFVEYNIVRDKKRMTELKRRTAAVTLPQIFIDGVNIGGFAELLAVRRAPAQDSTPSKPAP